jgi:L-iditol 2-dehydrogenase
MRVAMYYNNGDVRLERLDTPRISNGEILVKIISSGICGSDIMEWYRIKKAPLVLGHEIAGEVAESKADGYEQGDRVAVTHHVPCYECRYCRDGRETVCESLRTTSFDPGGFAEYARIPEINVKHGTFRLPDNVSYDEGTFVEPLGCVVRGQRAVGIKKGHTVVVLGSGISGMLHVQLAKASGADKVIATDLSESRLAAIKKLGADVVINGRCDVPQAVRDSNGGRLADRVIVCTGALPAMKQAMSALDRGGTLLFFAPTLPNTEFPIKVDEIWKNCQSLVASYAADKRDLQEALDLIRDRKIDVNGMITRRLGIEETGKGFRLFAAGEDTIKVLIRPHG